jgi:formyltetrahydrofolate deformylase
MENQTNNVRTAVLLIHCPDKRGIVASVTDFLHKNNGNIIHLDQHVDKEKKVFFMRVEWELDGFSIPEEEIAKYFQYSIGNIFNMHFELHFTEKVLRAALFVSKLSHCLYDVLSRYVSGEWKLEIPLIISNHRILEPVAKLYGIDFHYIPVDSNNKGEQECKQLEILEKYNIDFVVLARYMQILSGDFINKFGKPIINIHHSFLPAFPGAKPYHSAYERGVKLIGATGHYVSTELDAGPIIEQDVVRVTHKHTLEDLIRKGQDVEKLVLARAIWQHINHMTLVYENRTVVFS